MDKNNNTMLRNNIVTFYKNKNILTQDQVKQLETDYGKYCYVPFDLPVISDDKLIDWFFEKSKAINKPKPDIAGAAHAESLFNSINVYFDPEFRKIQTIWTINEVTDFDKTFPIFTQQIHDLLPVKRIPRLNFWQSTKQIQPHRDHANCCDFPNSVRIMLYDENPKETLYVQEDTLMGSAHRHYVKRLPETNTFAWNNLRVVHGSDYNPKYRKILMILNDFIVDYEKYSKLMDRSVKKYHDNILVSTNKTSDFVNIN